MSRRNRAPRRDVPPDPKYGSRLVTMLIRKLMMRGKASLAARILYEALDIVRERTGQDPLPFLVSVSYSFPLFLAMMASAILRGTSS
jgi:small subunit ribosomal protein S7